MADWKRREACQPPPRTGDGSAINYSGETFLRPSSAGARRATLLGAQIKRSSRGRGHARGPQRHGALTLFGVFGIRTRLSAVAFPGRPACLWWTGHNCVCLSCHKLRGETGLPL